LTRRNAFQNVGVLHIDILDPLMQRGGIKVPFEYFNIGQLWHDEREASNRACEHSVRKRHDAQTGLSASRFRRTLAEAMSPGAIDNFLKLLKKSPSGAVFNPWWQVDEKNDIGRNAPAIRRNQLGAYLETRVSTAKLAVIGEAVGYRGGHFSGIPMTSERLLLGRSKKVQIKSDDFFSDLIPRRTSKPDTCPDGFSEPTATIVWDTLLRLELKPDRFVLWNAFPWHSFDSRRG